MAKVSLVVVNVKILAPSVGACPDNVAAAGRACCCSSELGQAEGVQQGPTDRLGEAVGQLGWAACVAKDRGALRPCRLGAWWRPNYYWPWPVPCVSAAGQTATFHFIQPAGAPGPPGSAAPLPLPLQQSHKENRRSPRRTLGLFSLSPAAAAAAGTGAIDPPLSIIPDRRG